MYCGMKNIFLDRRTILGHGRKIGIFESKEKRWEKNSTQREELQSRHFREKPALVVMRGPWGLRGYETHHEGTRHEVQNFGLYLQTFPDVIWNVSDFGIRSKTNHLTLPSAL